MTRNYNNRRFDISTKQFVKKYGSPAIHLCEDKWKIEMVKPLKKAHI
jgi:hypothetical protein